MSQLMFSACLGVVLAGGKSSRMGQDKSLLKRNGQSMIDYSRQLLNAAGINDVVISGAQGVKDIVADLGPVGGIYSVLKQYQPQAMLILPVDLPLMDIAELKRLKQVGEISQQACYFENHHLPLYLPVNGYLTEFLTQAPTAKAGGKPNNKRNLNGPSVRSLLQQVPHQAISIKNSNALFNTNTPEQWQQAQHLLSQQRKNYV